MAANKIFKRLFFMNAAVMFASLLLAALLSVFFLRDFHQKSISGNEKMLNTALPDYKAGRPVAVVRRAMPIKQLDFQMDYIRRVVMYSAAAGLFLAFFLSLLAAGRFVRPLVKMNAAAAGMIRGNYSARIEDITDDDFGRLAESLNLLSEEIRKQIDTITEDKNELLAIVSSMQEGVAVISAKKRILLHNGVFSGIFSPGRERVEGLFYWEVIENDGVIGLIKQALEEKKNISGEIPATGPAGRSFQVRISTISGSSGGFLGAVAVFHDITEMRRAEKMRSEFVANVSHELKTPLTAIAGFAATLNDGAINNPEEAGRFLEIISRHTERLNRIVDDLLILSKLESGDTKMDMESIDIGEVISGVLELMSEKIKTAGLKAVMDIDAGLPAVYADYDKMEQVFLNLIDNAVKFTAPGGKISVRAGSCKGGVRIDISDTGTGIPQEHIEHIFERFYRADKARSREMGGTGLGLSIVRHILLSHKGSISVISHPGKGSAFTVYLPSADA